VIIAGSKALFHSGIRRKEQVPNRYCAAKEILAAASGRLVHKPGQIDEADATARLVQEPPQSAC
jgi:hypothetical protein